MDGAWVVLPNPWVRIGHTWDGVLGSDDVVFVRDTEEYEGDLGMADPRAIMRQLDLDVPRSRVFVGATRTIQGKGVLDAFRWPRMCTQAVLAPVVELLCGSGYLVGEGGLPMVVRIESPTALVVTKRLKLMPGGVFQHPTTASTDVIVRVSVNAAKTFVEVQTL